jgi:hypothetical protein
MFNMNEFLKFIFKNKLSRINVLLYTNSGMSRNCSFIQASFQIKKKTRKSQNKIKKKTVTTLS